MSKKPSHLTEVLNAVNLKSPCQYNRKEVSAYVLSLFLSEDPDLCQIVNEINPLHFSLDDDLIFKYYVSKVPKANRRLKFTQKSKEASDRDERIKALMKEHNISKREAGLSA